MTTPYPLRHAGLTVTLASAVPLNEWEKIEDTRARLWCAAAKRAAHYGRALVAHALHLARYAGRVFDDLTANVTAIRDLSRESSAVQEVDWTKHTRGPLFCPVCGDTLFCNRCGKDARGLSAADEPTSDAEVFEDTPLAELLDDHPIDD